MIAHAKQILKNNNLSEDYPEFIALKNHLDPHFNWIGYCTKVLIEDKVPLYDVFKMHDIFNKEKINLADVSKLKYSELDSYLKKRHVENDDTLTFIYTSCGYDIYKVHDYKGIQKIGSPLWCIKSQKYWDIYVGKNGTQYVMIKKDYSDILLDSKYSNIHTPKTGYNVKDPLIRFGVTFLNGTCTVHDENNSYIPNWGGIVRPSNLIKFDNDFRKEVGMQTYILHDENNNYANDKGVTKVYEDEKFIVTMYGRNRENNTTNLLEFYYIVKSKKLDVGENLNLMYLIINRKTIKRKFPDTITEIWNDRRSELSKKSMINIYESSIFEKVIARIGLHWEVFYNANKEHIVPKNKNKLLNLFSKK
jgi:hypothetical protein